MIANLCFLVPGIVDSYFIFLRKIINMILYRRNKGSNFLDKEWDNLIILDACRYDSFKSLFLKRKILGYMLAFLLICVINVSISW